MIEVRSILRAIEKQRALMIAVSTGGPRLNDVNDEYLKRHRAITQALSEKGIQNTVPYTDLWQWYSKWSSGDLPTYQSRRNYVAQLFDPLVERLSSPSRMAVLEPLEPTGWTRVDRALGKLREQLAKSKEEEDYQIVGLLSRELLISLAQASFNPARHLLEGDVPSDTDAKRMLDAVIAAELGGGENEALRRHAKAALSLANELVHKRTANFRIAALCAEATASTVNIIAIITGHRDP